MLTAVAVVIVLLAAAVLFARIAHHAGLPAPAAIVLVGIAANGMLPQDVQIQLTPATLGLFLPALIFEGAWSIDVDALRRAARAIAMLVLPGVLVTAFCIACAGTVAGGMSLPAAFALGAMLSATDPVAVLALFRTLGLPVGLLTIVEGESIANDGIAAVLVQIALLIAFARPDGVGALWIAGAYAPLAGIAIGIVAAGAAGPLLRRFTAPPAGIAVTVVLAYGSYEIASVAGASGILASAAAGVALSRLGIAAEEERTIDRFWQRTAFLANAIVFLLVGLSLRFDRLFHEPLLLLATIAAVALSRAILAYGIVPVRRAAGEFERGWRHAVALAGVRGGLSLALALGLPHDFPDRPEIIDAVFAVVFLTLVVQGWTLAPLLRRLSLNASAAQ